MKSGFVAIIGKPNAGKSTLINTLLKQKISIVTHKAQTTRNAILGIYNDKDSQIVFIDTPGIHKPTTSLGSYMNKEALSQAAGVDVIYYICDGKVGLSHEDADVIKQLKTYEVPIFLLINKIDTISKDQLIKRIDYASNNYEFNEIIPLSAINEENLEELIKTTTSYFKDETQYYPSDIKTTSTINFQIAEIIREKIILNTYEEIPHLTAVQIDEIKEKESKVFIEATIICNKNSHKGIIIGKGGSMLKKINDAASKDIKEIYHKRIILSLYVRIEEDWLNKEKKLFDLGYFKGDKDEQ